MKEFPHVKEKTQHVTSEKDLRALPCVETVESAGMDGVEDTINNLAPMKMNTNIGGQNYETPFLCVNGKLT